jgi:hypothetical protein
MLGSGDSAPRIGNLPLDGGEWSVVCPGPFVPWAKDPGTRWIRGRQSARLQDSVDSVEERTVVTFPGVEQRTYDSAVAQSVGLSLLFGSCILVPTCNTTAIV